MMKNNKGITLVALVTMIIVLIILASVSIYSSGETIKYVRFTNAKQQMEIMQTEINSLYEKYKSGDNTVLEYGVEISDASCDQEILTMTFSEAGVTDSTEMSRYRFYSESYIKDTLNVQGIDYDFLVNVQNRKIILFGGILYEDVEYYTAEDFGISNVETVGINAIDFKIVQGASAYNSAELLIYDLNFINEAGETVDVSKYKIKYKKSDSKYWEDITNEVESKEYSEEQADGTSKVYAAAAFEVTEEGTYEVMITTNDGNVTNNKAIDTKILKEGDTIEYTPVVASTNYVFEAQYSGYTSDQNISQESLQWQVFDANDDGSVEMIATTATQNSGICFARAVGYNNYVYALNDICANLYSNTILGMTARNLNLQDIERRMSTKAIDARNAYSNTDGEKYAITYNYPSGYYPILYSYEKGSGINSTTVTSTGVGISEKYYSNYTLDTYAQTGTTGLTATQTYYYLGTLDNTHMKNEHYYNIVFGENPNYWLASRCVNCSGTSHATFGAFSAGTAYLGAPEILSTSNPNTGTPTDARQLRPIVTIDSSFKYEYNESTSKWEIVK